MLNQILDRQMLALIFLRGRPYRWFSRLIARPNDFIQRLFIPNLNGLLDGDVLDDNKIPTLAVRSVRRADASVQHLSGTGPGLRRRIARVVERVSNSSVEERSTGELVILSISKF